MIKTLEIILVITILILISTIILLSKTKQRKDLNPYNIYYKKLFFLRKSELRFLKTISILENEYIIIPKLNLKKIITADKNKYKKELKNMTVDYAIFTKDYSQIVLMIELSYKSGTIDNQEKINKLKEICDDAGIKFITFEVNQDKENNNQEIINKVKDILKENI